MQLRSTCKRAHSQFMCSYLGYEENRSWLGQEAISNADGQDAFKIRPVEGVDFEYGFPNTSGRQTQDLVTGD